MTYTEAMNALNAAVYDAVRAANTEDGAPVDEIRKIKVKLDAIAKDVESLLDTRMTVQQYVDAEALYKGAKLAGLVR